MSITAERLVQSAGAALANRTSRRGFLSKSALVGSALAISPASYVLRPGTAYAAICNCNGSACDCGAQCCDGYTEFCCTLTGVNTCPPGTLAAGWWKVDGSEFCGGGPRYYLDCNAGCGGCGCGGSGLCSGACSGTGCGCAHGSCDNRKAGCTLFRYGQCNRHVACVGPIVCRVVTCVPPWQIDGSCGTTPLTDNNTRFHDRPCLHMPIGSLDGLHRTSPSSVKLVGWALDTDTANPVDVHVYVDGHFAGSFSANRSRPDVGAAIPGYGAAHGYDIDLSISPTQEGVCVYAINAEPGAYNPPIGCGAIARTPFGWVDEVAARPGGARVKGWVIDPDTANPLNVHAYIDGSYAGSFLASGSRPDVGAAYPGYGSAHGFEFTVAVAPGQHQICVYGINQGGGPTNPLLGCRPVGVGGIPFGWVEAVLPQPGGARVRGWVIDPDTAGACDIHAYIDGSVWGGSHRADQDRPDVEAAYPGFGRAHGFDFSVSLPAGSHQVCVYGINQGSGHTNPLLGCGTAAPG
jgi:hypothetical protein